MRNISHMLHRVHQRQIFVAALLITTALVVAFFFVDTARSGEPFTSSELGVASLSPAGEQGGFAVPASCEMGECWCVIQGCPCDAEWHCVPSPPPSCVANTGSSCTSSANACGMTNTGTIQCSGSCSASAPSDSECISFSVTPNATNEGDPVTITWSCVNDPSASGLNFSTGGDPSGQIVVNPFTTTTYGLSCPTGGFSSRTVTVREPITDITAAPRIILPNDTSTVSWFAEGVNSCVVTGTDGFSDSSGDISGGASWSRNYVAGPLGGQTTYTLTCQTTIQTLVKSVTININPDFEEF
jgi:hypothetical protein